MTTVPANGITLAVVESSSAVPAVDESTFIRLEKLSRKAADDSMQMKNAPRGGIAEDQFDSLAGHLLEIGLNAYLRFDPARTVSDRDGFSFAYREMRGYRQGRFTEGPYIDWLRTHVSDSRFEPKGSSTSVTETGELPEREVHPESALDAVAEHYAAGLSEREAWTLRHVATALASGHTLLEVVESLLSDLRDALAPQLPERAAHGLTTDLGSFEQLFTDWYRQEAAA